MSKIFEMRTIAWAGRAHTCLGGAGHFPRGRRWAAHLGEGNKLDIALRHALRGLRLKAHRSISAASVAGTAAYRFDRRWRRIHRQRGVVEHRL
jgi:hypothetical protein